MKWNVSKTKDGPQLHIDFFQCIKKDYPLDKVQTRDIDYLLVLGEIFTLVESRDFFEVQEDVFGEIFDFMVRDFSKYALQLF